MSYSSRRMKRRSYDVWPGYVDALSSMLMMIALVLLVMVAAQFYLGNAINSKDIALGNLAEKLKQLSASLSFEKQTVADLRTQKSELEGEKAKVQGIVASLEKNLAEREQALRGLTGEKQNLENRLTGAQKETQSFRDQLAVLAQQVEELNRQLGVLTADLSSAKSTLLERDKKIVDLDKKLQRAMVSKVAELAEYRSEFFGRLKRALGSRPEVRIVGDRFVFQSEVLFPTASAELGEGGRTELGKIADGIQDMSKSIPKDINWILTVIGHTDKLPINTSEFPSNWELSTARAQSVVRFLIEAGIPAHRLAVAGYGEHQPIEQGYSEEALAKNRRIELKFNQK
jgi:chemotaxis protein MotB